MRAQGFRSGSSEGGHLGGDDVHVAGAGASQEDVTAGTQEPEGRGEGRQRRSHGELQLGARSRLGCSGAARRSLAGAAPKEQQIKGTAGRKCVTF